MNNVKSMFFSSFFLGLAAIPAYAALDSYQQRILAIRQDMKPTLIPAAIAFFRDAGIADTGAEIAPLLNEDIAKDLDWMMEQVSRGAPCDWILTQRADYATRAIELQGGNFPEAKDALRNYQHQLYQLTKRTCPLVKQAHAAGQF